MTLAAVLIVGGFIWTALVELEAQAVKALRRTDAKVDHLTSVVQRLADATEALVASVDPVPVDLVAHSQAAIERVLAAVPTPVAPVVPITTDLKWMS